LDKGFRCRLADGLNDHFVLVHGTSYTLPRRMYMTPKTARTMRTTSAHVGIGLPLSSEGDCHREGGKHDDDTEPYAAGWEGDHHGTLVGHDQWPRSYVSE
jgi:hypothetical protein